MKKQSTADKEWIADLFSGPDREWTTRPTRAQRTAVVGMLRDLDVLATWPTGAQGSPAARAGDVAWAALMTSTEYSKQLLRLHADAFPTAFRALLVGLMRSSGAVGASYAALERLTESTPRPFADAVAAASALANLHHLAGLEADKEAPLAPRGVQPPEARHPRRVPLADYHRAPVEDEDPMWIRALTPPSLTDRRQKARDDVLRMARYLDGAN